MNLLCAQMTKDCMIWWFQWESSLWFNEFDIP